MVVKVCGDIKNAEKFVILRKHHKNYIDKYYTNNSHEMFTDFFKNVTDFNLIPNGVSYFEKQSFINGEYTIMFTPYYDYNKIGEKMRTIQNTYANYSEEEIEIDDPIKFLKDALEMGVKKSLDIHKKENEVNKIIDDFSNLFEKNEKPNMNSQPLIDNHNNTIEQSENVQTNNKPTTNIFSDIVEEAEAKYLWKSDKKPQKQNDNNIRNILNLKIEKIKSLEAQNNSLKQQLKESNDKIKTHEQLNKNLQKEVNSRKIIEKNLQKELELEKTKSQEKLQKEKERNESLEYKIEEITKDLNNFLPTFIDTYDKETSILTYEQTKTEEIYDLDETLYDLLINSIGTNLINMKFEKTSFKNANVSKASFYRITVNNLPTNKIVKLYEYLDNLLYNYYEDLPETYLQKDILRDKNEHIKLTHSLDVRLQFTNTKINILFGWFDDEPLVNGLKESPYSLLDVNFDYDLSDMNIIRNDIQEWRAEYYNRQYFHSFCHEKIEFEGDFIEADKCMVYVSIFDEDNVVKVGRSENWAHRKSQYYYDSEVQYNMLLAWYMYVPEHEDVEITKYIMYCLEDELKRLANVYFKPHKGKEYFKGTSQEESDNFIKIVDDKLKKLTIKEILNFRPESKIKLYASNNNRNYEKVVEILTKLRNEDE
jgi:hypothetical protein